MDITPLKIYYKNLWKPSVIPLLKKTLPTSALTFSLKTKNSLSTEKKKRS